MGALKLQYNSQANLQVAYTSAYISESVSQSHALTNIYEVGSADDFGNYFYGVAAKAMGITLHDAIQGAGAYAVYRKITGHYSVLTLWNFPGFFDEYKDTKTIIRGYYGN